MITLSRCFCGGVAHITAEESRYNNQYAPWDARCECSKCSFAVPPSRECETRENAVAAVADKWNEHSAIKTVALLQQQNAELVAQVEAIRAAWKAAYSWPDTVDEKQAIWDAISASPQQHLRDIQAEAGLKGYFKGTDDAWKDLTGGNSPEQMTAHKAIQYAERVKAGEV